MYKENHLIDFKYDIFDINHNYTKEQLINNKCVTAAIFLLEQKVEPYEFLERIKSIALFFDNLSDREMQVVKHWIKNSVEDKLAEEAVNILNSNKEEVKNMVAANAFILTEMKEKSKAEGKAEEKEKFRVQEAERVVKLLSKKFGELSQEIQDKIHGLNKEKLDSILDNILDIENLSDIDF